MLLWLCMLCAADTPKPEKRCGMKVITRYYFQQFRMWDDGQATGPVFEISKHRYEKGRGKGEFWELTAIVPDDFDADQIDRLGARRIL